MREIESFGDSLAKLNKMFDAKCNLSELQSTHLQVKSEFQEFKENILDDIDTVPARLGEIKAKYLGLMETLDPLERLFGSCEEFECVNKDGETKSIKKLLEGKSHLLL